MIKKFYKTFFILLSINLCLLSQQNTMVYNGRTWVKMTYREKYNYLYGYLNALELSIRIINKNVRLQKQANVNFVMPTLMRIIYNDIRKYEFNDILDVDQMVKSIDAIYSEKLNLNIPVEIVMLSVIERKSGNYERADRILIEARKKIQKGYLYDKKNFEW